MREYLLTLLITAAVTYLLTPLVRRVAMAVGAIHAARDRDVHTEPIPLLGGLAMYGGLAVGLLVAAQIEPAAHRVRRQPDGQPACCWPAASSSSWASSMTGGG